MHISNQPPTFVSDKTEKVMKTYTYNGITVKAESAAKAYAKIKRIAAKQL